MTDSLTDSLDSVDYPGIHHTSLEQRWAAALTVVEGVLRKAAVEDLPDDEDEADEVLDDLSVLLDALGLNFVSPVATETFNELAG